MPKDSLDFGLRDFGAFWALEVDLGFLLFVAYLSWLFLDLGCQRLLLRFQVRR